MKSEIEFYLTQKQIDICEDMFTRARQADQDEKPGIVSAQLYESGRVKASFIEHDTAEKLQAIVWEA